MHEPPNFPWASCCCPGSLPLPPAHQKPERLSRGDFAHIWPIVRRVLNFWAIQDPQCQPGFSTCRRKIVQSYVIIYPYRVWPKCIKRATCPDLKTSLVYDIFIFICYVLPRACPRLLSVPITAAKRQYSCTHGVFNSPTIRGYSPLGVSIYRRIYHQGTSPSHRVGRTEQSSLVVIKGCSMEERRDVYGILAIGKRVRLLLLRYSVVVVM